MKKIITLIIFFCSIITAHAQGEVSNWFFGNGAGIVFDTNAGTVTPTDVAQGNINTSEGCSSMTSADGVLQFYTDGRTVWNRNHEVMPGADYDANPDEGLFGDPSSTSSALVIPKPFSDTEYYVFTVDEPHHQNAAVHPNKFNGTYQEVGETGVIPEDDNGYNKGLNYTLIDMSLEGGLGDIVPTEKNVPLETYDPSNNAQSSYKCSEKITAVEDADCTGFWVITQFIDSFYAFRVTDQGVNKTPVITAGIQPTIPLSGYRRNGLGYIKASPLGDKLAVCHTEQKTTEGSNIVNPGSFWIYDFDKATGIVSGGTMLKDIRDRGRVGPYGTEFSQDGTKLYMSTMGFSIYQFDLEDNNKETEVKPGGMSYFQYGALQLGPDGKIYIATRSTSLAVINRPNEAGEDCDLENNAIELSEGTNSMLGLPPFVSSFLVKNVDIIQDGISTTDIEICDGDKYTLKCVFYEGATYQWKKDGVIITNETKFELEVDSNGVYEVEVVTKDGICLRVKGKATVLLKPSPEVKEAKLESCDEDGDGQVEFDLTKAAILVTADPMTIKYYPTRDDAINDTAEIVPATAYLSAPGSVWASVKSSDSELECLSYAEIKLEIIEQADPGINGSLASCKNGDAVDLFTLLGGTPTTGGTWTPALASGTGIYDPAVDAAGTYTYTINTPGCEPVASEVVITITADDNPAFAIDPSCSGAIVTITGGATGTFVFNPLPPAGDTAVLNPTTGEITNAVAGTTYSIEFTTNGECFATLAQEVTLLSPPNIVSPTVIVNCDEDDNDGETLFDLTTRTTEVLNGLPAGDYTITFYATQADAEVPQNAIAQPNAYVGPTGTIYVRVDQNGTDCYSIVPLEVKVNDTPLLNEPKPIAECIVNGDMVFNLEDKLPEILNGQTDINITFHTTQQGAITKDNSIPDPINYTVNGGAGAQTVWIRGEYGTTSDCVSFTSLELQISPIPKPNVTPVEVCDDDNDGFSVFNLEDLKVNIANGEGTTVTYHSTAESAENGSSEITEPNYTNNSPNTETVYVRVEYPGTGCYVIQPLDLNVTYRPDVPLGIEDYILCDEDGDDEAIFDLDTVITPQVIGGQTGVTISYHTSQADADTGNAPIAPTNAYQSASKIVYIRLENSDNICAHTGQFAIVALPMPAIVQPTDLVECDDEDVDGFSIFDLTTKNAEITGGNSSLKVTYYEEQGDAKQVLNPTAYRNKTATAQTLFVKVENNDEFACSAFVTLTIRVVPNPTPGEPEDLVTCDNGGNDNIAFFDLTENEAAILNGETNVALSYYTNLGDANTAQTPIPTANLKNHQNVDANGKVVNPQTIYVRVESTSSEEGELKCYAVVSFKLFVDPQPDFASDITPYTACDSDGDNIYPFDLSSKIPEILGKEPKADYNVSFHESQAEADAGTGTLPNIYYNNPNDIPKTIYVRIESISSRCTFTGLNFVISLQQGVEINSDGEPLEITICDDNIELDGNPANDSAQFDLTTLNPEVLDGQDPATFIVSYYEDFADAEEGVNAIYDPTQYNNTVNPQILYVRVDNDAIDTGGNDISECYAVTTLKLNVNPLPPVDLEDVYILCQDTNGSEVNEELTLDTELSANEFSFKWTKDPDATSIGTASYYKPTVLGTYSVEITNKNTGCTVIETTDVIPGTPPIVKAQATSFKFADSHTIVVTATSSGYASEYEFSLDGGPWLTNTPNDGVFTFYNVAPGMHEITVRDIRGCGIAKVVVQLLGYPPFFTPNNDSYHDTWNIYGIENHPEAKIHIFDRYGKLLKQISPIGEGWDGTLNGKLLPSTDYWFMVEYVDRLTNNVETFKGHFTLKR